MIFENFCNSKTIFFLFWFCCVQMSQDIKSVKDVDDVFYPFPKIHCFKAMRHQLTLKPKPDASKTEKTDTKVPSGGDATFHGSVKLHGTNGSFVFDPKTYRYYAQSRNQILKDDGADNHGWRDWLAAKDLKPLMKRIVTSAENAQIPTENTRIAVFGEVCGPGIQKGVAISALPYSFTIFAVRVYNLANTQLSTWLRIDKDPVSHPSQSIYNIFEYLTYTVTVRGFYSGTPNPEDLKKIDELSDTVANSCPVAVHRSRSNNGNTACRGNAVSQTGEETKSVKAKPSSVLGEGIVWAARSKEDGDSFFRHAFKSKGAAYTKIDGSKPKKEGTKELTELDRYVTQVCTNERFNQAMARSKELTKDTKDAEAKQKDEFLTWFVDDTWAETRHLLVDTKGCSEKKAKARLLKEAKGEWFSRMRSLSASS